MFSLVGIIALQAGCYTNFGRLVLFAATGTVIAAVVLALLRWISHLMTFGSDTLDRVEPAASAALDHRLESAPLGGRPLRIGVPGTCVPLLSSAIGYVQHVDVGKLDACAEGLKIKVRLSGLPGAFVHEASARSFTSIGKL